MAAQLHQQPVSFPRSKHKSAQRSRANSLLCFFPSLECQSLFATDQCSLIALSPHSQELMGNTGITHQLLAVHFSFLPPFDLHIHLIAGVFELHVQGTALSLCLHEEIFVPAELMLCFLPFPPVLLEVFRQLNKLWGENTRRFSWASRGAADSRFTQNPRNSEVGKDLLKHRVHLVTEH